MKTIRRQIATPLILVCVLIPLLSMLLFNVAMSVYVDSSTREELIKTAGSVKHFLRKSESEEEELDEIGAWIGVLREALSLTKISANTELFVITSSGKTLFTRGKDDSFLNDEIIDTARNLLEKARVKEIVRFQKGGSRYFAVYRNTSDTFRSVRLVFISSADSAAPFLRAGNLIFIGITLLAAALGTLAVARLSRRITDPIVRLSACAKRIGDGEYIKLDEDTSSVETAQLTQSVNEMSAQLKRSAEAQKAFFQNASHALRTPLMCIQGYAEGLRDGVFQDAAGVAESICLESAKLNQLVNEQLTLSRIEGREDAVAFARYDLNNLMRDCLQGMEGLAIKEGRKLAFFESGGALPVLADEELLQEAVSNVVANCLRHARKTVRVSLRRAGARAVAELRDDGAGIAAEDLPHIFERYYRGRKGKTGLGLAIARAAVGALNGELRAYNEGGAVFEISLPICGDCAQGADEI